MDLLALLAEFYRQRALGQRPAPHEFAARAGSLAEDFLGYVQSGRSPPAPFAPLYPFRFGSYLVTAELGRGGTSVVYDALEWREDRRVALKILSIELVENDLALARFAREAESSARIRHPRIVELLDAGIEQGRPYLAFERIAGRTLAQLWRADEMPAPRPLLKTFLGVVDAVHALHEAGAIHRDLKPSNVMIRDDGVAMLLDLGLAFATEDRTVTRTGAAVGSLRYMSPEQILGRREEVDRRTDIYGLAATLYFALTGRPVVEAKSPSDAVREVLDKVPCRASEHRPGLPPALDAALAAALEKDPANRPETAQEWRNALAAVDADLENFL